MEIKKILESRFAKGILCGALIIIVLCGAFMLGRVSAYHRAGRSAQGKANYQQMQAGGNKNNMMRNFFNGKTPTPTSGSGTTTTPNTPSTGTVPNTNALNPGLNYPAPTTNQ